MMDLLRDKASGGHHGKDGEDDDRRGMRQRDDYPEKHGIPDTSSFPHQVGGHHRLAMPWLKGMQGSQPERRCGVYHELQSTLLIQRADSPGAVGGSGQKAVERMVEIG